VERCTKGGISGSMLARLGKGINPASKSPLIPPFLPLQ